MYCLDTNFYAILLPKNMNTRLIGIVNTAIIIGTFVSNYACYGAIIKLNAYPKLNMHGNIAVMSTYPL